MFVDISGKEYFYLQNAEFLPADIASALSNAEEVSRKRYRLQLEDVDAERIRDIFTERLALVGFDQDYNPTEEGKTLESLIDSFYAPPE